MKAGVILPTFSETADEAMSVARRAEEVGIDGVFCYDHLWPMGQPDRPALAPFPVLAAVAATTQRISVGTLVARIGLVPDEVLVTEFETLDALAPGRVVAGLGTGDRLSADENRAYGISFRPADERVEALRRCARALRARSIAVWVGGASRKTMAVAEEEQVVANLWDAPEAAVADQAARSEVTWAGPPPTFSDASGELASLFGRLSAAGATWAVLGWPVPLEAMAAAARGLTPRAD